MDYTSLVESIAKELGIEFSVALDIQLLREYEQRIVMAAKANPHMRDFKVHNPELEDQLSGLEIVKIKD